MLDMIFWALLAPVIIALSSFTFKNMKLWFEINKEYNEHKNKVESITDNDLVKFKKILDYLNACVVKLDGSDKFFLSENDDEAGNKPVVFYREGSKLLRTNTLMNDLENRAGFHSINDMIIFVNNAYADIIFRKMNATKIDIDNYNDTKDLTKNNEEDLISQLVKASVNGEKDAEEEIFDKILELKK